MNKVTALVLKIGAFLVFCLSFWKWGQVTAERNEAEKKADESIRKDENYKKIISDPPVDDAFLRMCKKK